MQKITIIGGTSGFGEWMAGFILKKFPTKVELTITGVNEQRAQQVAHTLGCNYSLNNREAVQDADITVFAVPIAYTSEIIQAVCPALKKGSMVLDVTSIKKAPSQAMHDSVSEDILIVPTHPMFGPYISTIAGQIIVLTPEERSKRDQRYIFLKSFLEAQGAKVIEASPLEHDKMMAVVQGLTHFNMFVLGETIKRLDLDIQKSLNFVSPIYKIMISSVARYMNQNPKLYADIQMFNTQVLEIHKVFMETTNDFNKFVKQKDEKSFIATLENTKAHFGDNAQKGQQYTDKIIYMIGQQAQKAKDSIGKEISLINIYTQEKINARLISFQNDTLELSNNLYLPIDTWEIL